MISFRQMTVEDIPEVAELEKKCFSDPWSDKLFLLSLLDDKQYFIVAENDGHTVGYAGMMMVLDEGQILNVAVDKASRQQGIGRRLMEEMISAGKDREMTFFTLEVREGNTPARRLYESLGFVVTGKRPDYYSEPTEAAILMDLTCAE